MGGSGKSVLLRAAEATGRVYGLDPRAYDAAYVEGQLPVWWSIVGPGRWFDTRIEGLAHVPPTPSLIVSNHGGGTTALDAIAFTTEWYREFGTARPLHGLVHEMVFASHGLGRYFERCGALRARRDLAEDVVRSHGRSLLVMPGGDQEVWRPARDRYTVRFGGRTGYARTALTLGVPVVPMAHAGAHHTLHVLTDGRALVRRIKGFRSLARAEVWPVHLSFPWGLALGPVPHLPPPAALDYRLAEPIAPAGPATDTNVRDLDEAVRARIQGMLDQLREERHERERGVEQAARRLRDAVHSLRDLVREVRALDARDGVVAK
jgi:1-acyl-sn-glycerol-3-phosphate acyltransferase